MSRIDEALTRIRRERGAPPPEDRAGLGTPQAEFEHAIEELHRSELDPPAAAPANGHPVMEAGPLGTPDTGFGGMVDRIPPELAEKVVVGAIQGGALEQYRKVAGALHHVQVDRQIKVVMVVSPIGQDGKTLTAANLALTLSESYRRQVLLVDADLRRPCLHELFHENGLTGLTDGLHATKDERLSIRQISPWLSLLPAGRPDPDPMSALTSSRMQRVLDEARELFDWIIIDTPPVAVLPDANLLAAMVDGAVLVIKAGVTPLPMVKRAIDAVGRDRILGVILNAATAALAEGYHPYYHSRRPRNES